MKIKFNQKNGITLIALVITIIVLLILAGIAISMLTGDNGILNKAAEAKVKTEEAKSEEEYRLTLLAAASNVNGTTHTEILSDLNEDYQEVTVKIPAGFAISPREGEQNIETGMVIIDTEGNEYVWIPVFTSKQKSWGANYSSLIPERTVSTSDFKTTHINKIRTALTNSSSMGYTKTYYNNSQTDTWYGNDQYGQKGYYEENDTEQENLIYYTNGNMTEEEYNNLFNKMLISVYKNGGFYIGRYEMGTSVVNSTTEAQSESRTSASKEYEASNTNTTNKRPKIGASPVIKKNAVPYNYITQSQAEMLAESLNHKGGTDSILFGLQWKMVQVFIEKYGKIDSSAIEGAGTSFTSDYLKKNTYIKLWGNMQSSTFNMNQGFYTTTYNSSNTVTWNNKSNSSKGTSDKWLCTTGASEQNKVLNIYDFVGNEYEWTLEKINVTNLPCVLRGPYFMSGDNHVVVDNRSTCFSSFEVTSRPSLYID